MAIYKYISDFIVNNGATTAGMVTLYFVVFKAGEYHSARVEGLVTSEDVAKQMDRDKRAILRYLGVPKAVEVKLYGSSEE